MERSLSILLADSEEIVRKTVAGYLRESGHFVDKECNARCVLKAVERRFYDLALVDIRLSGMDGLALLARIREARPKMPVVIMTGRENMSMAVESLHLGAADFLTKPIRLLELDAVLEKSTRLCRLITQKSQALEEIKEAERRYRLLAESVTDVVWETDLDMRFTYVSPVVTRLLGYSVEEVLSLTWQDILADGVFENIRQELVMENLDQKHLFQILEMGFLHRDGSVVWTNTRVAALRDQNGQPVGILGVSREINERKG